MISSIDTFADKITKLCINAELRRDMGQNSLVSVERDFQWKSVGRKYLNVFEMIVKKEKF